MNVCRGRIREDAAWPERAWVRKALEARPHAAAEAAVQRWDCQISIGPLARLVSGRLAASLPLTRGHA
jgi:hypothetical protein